MLTGAAFNSTETIYLPASSVKCKTVLPTKKHNVNKVF